MSEPTENKLVSAQLERVPWWRVAIGRLATGKRRRHQETLDRLAERDVTDTIGEADVNSWLAMLEGQSRRQASRRRNR
ncbi:MAG: hypothetical protein KGL25_05925 [Gammaproteobacteria bacterium]|nr:hypothetical protein [Gammaproteobacteria bacterium]